MTEAQKSRLRHHVDQVVYYAGITALILVAIVAVVGFIDRLDRVAEDRQARLTSCVVTQVLEVSRERARQEGNLTGDQAALYASVFASLPRDCPKLIQLPADLQKDAPDE